ncbi:hypothetical protein SEA_OTTAWA_56 [Arthrobacter phage Ottawa]|nr:hypothetical protein SEA_OTTAWA_56 [Arthrobacter phage Ottawa]
MVWARQQKVGKGGAKFCLVVLGELCDDEGKTTRSRTYIAQIMEQTPTAVGVNLAFLEERGFITRTRRMSGLRRLSDTIQLHIPGIYQMDTRNPMEPELPEAPETGATEAPETGATEAPETGALKDKHLTTNLEEITTTPPAAADGPQRNAQTLLGEWIDHCNPKPPSRVKGQMAREIKNLLAEGMDYDAVRDGLIELHRKGQHPSTLPSFVHAVQQRPAIAMQPSGIHNGHKQLATGTQRAMEALAAGQQLQEQIEQQGTVAIGYSGNQQALGAGGTGGQQESGPGDGSGVVGNPQPFRFS